MRKRLLDISRLFLVFPLFLLVVHRATAEPLALNEGDHIAIIGNTLADRMQHHGWLETYLVATHPNHDLTIRNLGFSGDEVKTRPRSQDFGSPDQWLTKVEADVVLCFFGYNEALRGEAGLAQFQKDLGEMLDGMLEQKYNGKTAPKIVVFSPIAHENLRSPILPDGSENNKKLALYSAAMKTVCESKNVKYVDLFEPTKNMYVASIKPLTLNGIHMLDHGNRLLAQEILKTAFGKQAPSDSSVEKLREAVLEKNYYWFSRYRVVDGYNVYGGRSTLNWHGQSNQDVMRREMEIFDVMTGNRDKRVWAVAKGNTDYQVVDNNIPEQLVVKTNKAGDKEDGSFSYLGGEEAISKMQLAPGMKANLFASEEMFPEIVNPVQMAVDTDGRLFASVWPSYPHWNPTQPREDRIVCLPDDDGDGVADRCVTFADELNSVTGFEFWGGGMLVCSPPEIWFLKDTDGDDKADLKIRMLQGVSSADTHHTANAMVIGPDGGLYWSRGVFHVTNMETPTKTFRSTSSGVYRFDPRTFEIGFHFPIGPNPHGDFFDQWGYQFVNDGTGGTGSYVNIGKGIGNKQWFKKRVRPVAATGMLSSSHFPEENQGNFLICNTIGFLGVLQHKVKYNGADIYAEEIEPIVVSSDPNFRPTDIEIAGDGALYVSDWSNALIGHMQHNMRDPNRDHAHGRIYRITYEGRDLLKPVKLKGKPIATVLNAFYAKENGVRYRARLELSGRETKDVLAEVAKFISDRDPSNPADAQALLECLWVHEEHRVPNHDLVKSLMRGAAEPRVRAAAIRTLGHWGTKVDNWQPTLQAAAQDESALVRAEAVKAAVSFTGLEAAEVIFEVANQPTDPELDVVINYARGQINVDAVVQDAVKAGKKISVAAQKYVLRNASVEDLLKLDRSEAVYHAILERPNATAGNINDAISGLAKAAKSETFDLLISTIKDFDQNEREGNLAAMGELLTQQDSSKLANAVNTLRELATSATSPDIRQAGYAAWINGARSSKAAFKAASNSKESLRDFLLAIPQIGSEDVRSGLFDAVKSLAVKLPSNLESESQLSGLSETGIKVDYFDKNPGNVARETLEKMTPAASGVVPEITIDVPQLGSRDGFALRFSGTIRVDRAGR
ncbi:MAG: HEAT repeat domain-containing protein, partial [Planctomycetales bacterium]|nr:HEAT repeat domain-containing protein [Planctomycetales bacterium]